MQKSGDRGCARSGKVRGWHFNCAYVIYGSCRASLAPLFYFENNLLVWDGRQNFTEEHETCLRNGGFPSDKQTWSLRWGRAERSPAPRLCPAHDSAIPLSRAELWLNFLTLTWDFTDCFIYSTIWISATAQSLTTREIHCFFLQFWWKPSSLWQAHAFVISDLDQWKALFQLYRVTHHMHHKSCDVFFPTLPKRYTYCPPTAVEACHVLWKCSLLWRMYGNYVAF